MKRISLPFICLFLIFGHILIAQGFPQETEEPIPQFTDEELIQRLRTLPRNVVKPRFNRIVRSYISTYTLRNREKTCAMLGRSVLYFPIFENYLASRGLPDELKVLPIVESALNPEAVSRSKAVGLWQFMEATAREQGLRISRHVDERKDPYRSTEAALHYLEKLYNRYGDWALALAAYNGGPGRVNRAIRRGSSRDFWRIRPYLPRETRNYVPAFIAALYIWNYYHLHGLVPQYPADELLSTGVVKVHTPLSFDQISKITGFPPYVIEYLNPSYRYRYIPASTEGFNLILPQRAIPYLVNKLGIPDMGHQFESNPIRVHSAIHAGRQHHSSRQRWYTVKSGDSLYGLARKFKCTVAELMQWNRLNAERIRVGQTIVVFPSGYNRTSFGIVNTLPSKLAQVTGETSPDPRSTLPPPKRNWGIKGDGKYFYHYLEEGETLKDVSARYDVKLKKILRWNKWSERKLPGPGARIKIKN